MTAVFVLPVFDRLEVVDEVAQRAPLFRFGLKESPLDLSGVEPQKVADGIVLSVRPAFVQFAQRHAVEPHMRPVHRITGVGPSFDDVGDATTMTGVELHDGRSDALRHPHPSGQQFAPGHMDVVPDPDILVAGLRQFPRHPQCRREQPRRQCRTAERPLFIEESDQPLHIVGRDVFGQLARQVVRVPVSHASGIHP